MKKLMAIGLALASLAAFADGGNLRYSIMVNKFENKANGRGQWELVKGTITHVQESKGAEKGMGVHPAK